MELKTKYQYTYFIYPYLIEKKAYNNYLYKLLKKKQCKLKFFDRKKDVAIDSYFLPEIKDKIFWSLDMNKEAIKNYETMDLKMKAAVLSKQPCSIFEYELEQDIPGKIGEDDGIFFDISKVEIVCFNTGICFLLMKTVLNNGASFSDVLNFNYKFREIQSKIGHTKEYDNIKIQTKKLENMKKFSEFIEEIAGSNITAKKLNLDTEKLITYSYTCLEQDSWNENTDLAVIEKEFEKYRYVKTSNEQINDITNINENVYKEKYVYYAFSNNATVLLTSESNITNYTNLLFQHENSELYHFIYHLHQKIYLKKLNYEFQQTKKFENIKDKFIKFAKKDWIYEVTNDAKGTVLDKYYRKTQNLDDIFIRLKSNYDLLYKEYEIGKTNKNYKWVIAVIAIIMIINLINLWGVFGN